MNELTLTTPPPGITAADYSAIEDAVMETARGRWFLLEYARRQRAAETQRLADAVDRLENVVSGMAPPADPAPRQTPEASAPDATAAAVAEKLSDIVWTMRERGVGDQFCAELEKQIRIIRSFRAELQGGQQPVVETLQIAAPATDEPAAPQGPAPVALELPPPWRPLEAAARPDAPDPRVAALSRLDALPLIEKIALFC